MSISPYRGVRPIGYKPEFKYIAWQKKNELLATGELDCVAGCFSMTDREADYRWAGPYVKKPSSGCRGAFELDSLVAGILRVKSIASAIHYQAGGGILLNHHEPRHAGGW